MANADQDSGKRGINIAIVVALIGLLGTVFAAVISNYDKLFTSIGGNTVQSGYPSDMGPLEYRTNRNGSDISQNPEHASSPEECARMCSAAKICKAMTYVISPNGLPQGDCWLKTIVPPSTVRPDMTSAVKR